MHDSLPLGMTDSVYSQIDSQKYHKFVDFLMSWERINAKPLVTTLFFKMFDKTGNFAVLMISCALPVPANQYLSRQKFPFYFKFSAELNEFTPSF